MTLTPEILSARQGPVWLQIGTLLDGLGAPVRNGHLVYAAGGILYAGAATPPPGLLRAGQAAPDAVLPGHTVLPGLIEAHAHLFLEGGEELPERRAEYLKQTDAELTARAVSRLRRLLELGVIAVRDAGDKNGTGLALQARYRAAETGTMPYVDSPGPAIHHQGRYGSFMGRPMEDYPSIEACVDGRIADGAFRIKLLATGIINFEKGAVLAKPQMPVEELSRFTAAARARGRQTFAHCSGNDGVTNCVAARVDTIEHGFFVDDAQLAQMRDADIGWVPTFAPVQFQVDKAVQLGWSQLIRDNLQRILDGHAASLVKAAALGVRVIAGSDAGSHGVPHGWGLLDELRWMERAGLTPQQVINAATGAGGSRLGFPEEVGVLRAGAKSRFILTEQPVLETVAHLGGPKCVVFDGVVFTHGDNRREPGL
jgi:imidazolonepropionase-like amidohydrolase